MKTLYILVVISMMASPVNAFTINIGDREIDTKNITPDDGVLYSLDTFFEAGQVALTRNKGKKIELKVASAEERLREAQDMALENKENESLQALNLHNRTLEIIDRDIEKIENEDELNRAKVAFTNHKEKMEEQKQKVLDTLPDNSPAKDKIREAFDRSIAKAKQKEIAIDIKITSIEEVTKTAINAFGEMLGVNSTEIIDSLKNGDPLSDNDLQKGVSWVNTQNEDLSALNNKTIIVHLIKEETQFQVIHVFVENNTISIVQDPLGQSIDIDLDVVNIDKYLDVAIRGSDVDMATTLVKIGGSDLRFLI
jgi:hypothetical protein